MTHRLRAPPGVRRAPPLDADRGLGPLYNASSSDTSEHPSQDETPSPPGGSSFAGGPSNGTPRPDEAPSLSRALALAVDVPAPLPPPDPALQPTPVGHVRADLERQLEQTVLVLTARYASDVPRSLVLEFALRQVFVQLHKHGAESPLVEWLDDTLSRL